jgi:hypothetical protein
VLALGILQDLPAKTNNKKLHEKEVCTTWVYTKCYAFIQEGQLPLVGPSSIERWVFVTYGHAQSWV